MPLNRSIRRKQLIGRDIPAIKEEKDLASLAKIANTNSSLAYRAPSLSLPINYSKATLLTMFADPYADSYSQQLNAPSFRNSPPKGEHLSFPSSLFSISSSSPSAPLDLERLASVNLHPSPDDWRLYTHVIINNLSLFAWLDNGANVNVISPCLAEFFSSTNAIYDFPCNTSVFGDTAVSTSRAIDLIVLHKTKPFTIKFIIADLPDKIPLLFGLPTQTQLGISVSGLSAGPDDAFTFGPTPADLAIEENDDPHVTFYSDLFSSANDGEFGDLFYPDSIRSPILASIQPFVKLNEALDPHLPCSFPGSVVHLVTNDNVEYWSKQYPIPQALQQSLKDYFEDLFVKGFIEEAPIGCKFNLPHCAAPKKHPITREKIDVRWCLDPRLLNAHLKPTPNVLPKMSELFAAIQSSEIFSAIDLRHAYLQFDLNETDRHKTAFSATIRGKTCQWMYKRAIWGIRHLSHHVQSIMRAIFSDMPFVTVYIDDLIVHSPTPEAHADHLAAVIQRLTKYNLIINFEKTNIGMSRFRAFGHIASGSTLCADPQKVAAVLAWPIPKTGTDVESFLGFVNWLRDFIPNYAAVAAPLEAIRKLKNVVPAWKTQHLESFRALKKLVEMQIQIFKPSPSHILQVATDASNYAIGAILYQVIDGKCHYISFHSKSLSKSQRNYSATKRELFGIVSSLRAFREFLYGTYFHLHTDHKALVFLHTQRHLNPMLLTWFEELLELDFDIFHRPGLDNIMPDALSRVYKYCLSSEFQIDPISPSLNSSPTTSRFKPVPSLFCASSDSHAYSKPLVEPVSSDSSIESSEPEKALAADLLHAIRIQPPTTKPFQTMQRFISERLNKKLPTPEEQQQLLATEHQLGHFGASSIVSAILDKGFWWPSCLSDAEQIVSTCPSCQRFNIVREGFHPLRMIATTCRFNHWAVDLAVDLPESPDGFKHILIVLIRGSEFRLLVPLKDKRNTTVATALWSLMSIFGPPAIIQSDRGSEFIENTVKALTSVHGIDHRLIAQYNPRANGAVEKCVGTTKKLLVKLCDGSSHNWPLFLPTIQFFFNRKINPTTGSAPFSLMFGRAITGFENFQNFVPDSLSPEEFATFSKTLFQELDNFVFPAVTEHVSVRHNITAAQTNAKRKIFDKPLPVGTVVNVTADPFVRKIFGEEQSHGPFIITGVTPNLLYFLADDKGQPFARPVPITQLKLLNISEEVFRSLAPEGENVAVTKVLDVRDDDSGETFYLLKFRGIPIPEWTPAKHCHCESKIRAFRRERALLATSTSLSPAPGWPSEIEALSLAASLKPGQLIAVRDSDAAMNDFRYLVGEVISLHNNSVHLHYLSVDSGSTKRTRPRSEPLAAFRKTFIHDKDKRPLFNYRKPNICPPSCSPWLGDEDVSNILAVDLKRLKNSALDPSDPNTLRLKSFLPTTLQEINLRPHPT